MIEEYFSSDRHLKWLPLLVLALASAIAWGSQVTKTDEHDRRITQHEITLEKLTDIQSRILVLQSRIDERTTNTSTNVKENKVLMLQVLHEIRINPDLE